MNVDREDLRAIVLEMREELSERLERVENIALANQSYTASILQTVSSIKRDNDFINDFAKMMRKTATDAHDREQEKFC